MFTTALNDNATRGQLSINQPPNLAAWSAVLSGVIVLTNKPGRQWEPGCSSRK